MRFRDARAENGWTLLELMVVVLILAILVSIAIASYTLTTDRARRVTCQQNQRSLNMAVQVYEGKEGHLPPTLADLAPYVAKSGYDKCPSGPTYSYNATTGLVTCPIHPAQ